MTRSLTALVLGLLMASASAVGGEPKQDPYDRAYELYSQGRYKEAEREYRKALSENPDSIGANLELGRLLREMGRAAEAIPFLVRAQKLAPKLATASSELGTAQLALKDWENAERNLRMAVRLDAKDADSWWRLGYVYTQRGKLPESEKALKKAVGLDADLSEAWLDLGLLQRITGKTKEAIKSLRTAMETDPASAVAFKEYGEIVDKHGDEKQRVFLVGMRAHNEGDYKEAEQWIRELLDDDPENGRCLILMGHIHLHQDPPKAKEAIEFYEKGLSNVSKGPRAERLPFRSRSFTIEGLGIAYLLTEDLKNAKNTFKRGTKLDKEYAGHFYYLAVVAAREGKIAEVCKKLTDVRMRDYNGSWVKRAREDPEFKSFSRRREFLEALRGKG